MSEFGIVEDTLFIPMAGRIYASENCPKILYDEKALALKERLPMKLLEQGKQSQYTLVASASRSANMDRCIRKFLLKNPEGIIVQLGCGLETTYYRCGGENRWYAVDLPNVIDYRTKLLPQPERETYLAEDAFSENWLQQVRAENPEAPLLITAGGLFHYFEEEKVLELLRLMGRFGDVELIFDTVNKRGMAMLQKKYMKKIGHGEARMFFYVDSASDLAVKLGIAAEAITEKPYYQHISKKGLNLSTRVSMTVSDQFGMVKMVHIQMGKEVRNP